MRTIVSACASICVVIGVALSVGGVSILLFGTPDSWFERGVNPPTPAGAMFVPMPGPTAQPRPAPTIEPGVQLDPSTPSPPVTTEEAPPVPTPEAEPSVLPLPPFRPITRVVLPSISLDADVTDAKLLEQHGGWTWDIPAFRVGHAEMTAGAGGPGNAVLLGHVSSRAVGNVFHELGRARVGDRVYVSSGEEQFEYRVVDVHAVDRRDASVLRPTERPSVSLITCAGAWLPLVNDYAQRLVVKAELAATVAVARTPPAPVAAGEAAASHQTAPRRTIIDERFIDNRHGWVHDPRSTARFEEGGYRLTVQTPGRFVAVGVPIAEQLANVVASGTFRKIGGPPGGGYGLILRDQNSDRRDGIDQGGRFYVFEVGDRREVGVWRREQDSWVDLLSWMPSEVVQPVRNQLTIRANGDLMTFEVNGIVVANVADTALPRGGVGLFVGGDFNDVVAEHFVVRE